MLVLQVFLIKTNQLCFKDSFFDKFRIIDDIQATVFHF